MTALEVIRQFLARHYGVDPERVTAETKVQDVGIDSLVQIELVFEFETKLGATVPLEDLPPPQTVGDLIRLADKLRADAP